MNDYISRQKAIEIINHYAEMALYRMLSLEPGSRAYLIAELQYGDRKHIRKMVEGIPAADVRPVVYGQWVKIYEDGEPAIEQHQIGVFCSKCMKIPKDRFTESEFCPNCGADMRGKRNATP